MNAGLTSGLFWAPLAGSVVVAFLLTMPVNRWMIPAARATRSCTRTTAGTTAGPRHGPPPAAGGVRRAISGAHDRVGTRGCETTRQNSLLYATFVYCIWW
jgi:hypothetical protein